MYWDMSALPRHKNINSLNAVDFYFFAGSNEARVAPFAAAADIDELALLLRAVSGPFINERDYENGMSRSLFIQNDKGGINTESLYVPRRPSITVARAALPMTQIEAMLGPEVTGTANGIYHEHQPRPGMVLLGMKDAAIKLQADVGMAKSFAKIVAFRQAASWSSIEREHERAMAIIFAGVGTPIPGSQAALNPLRRCGAKDQEGDWACGNVVTKLFKTGMQAGGVCFLCAAVNKQRSEPACAQPQLLRRRSSSSGSDAGGGHAKAHSSGMRRAVQRDAGLIWEQLRRVLMDGKPLLACDGCPKPRKGEVAGLINSWVEQQCDDGASTTTYKVAQYLQPDSDKHRYSGRFRLEEYTKVNGTRRSYVRMVDLAELRAMDCTEGQQQPTSPQSKNAKTMVPSSKEKPVANGDFPPIPRKRRKLAVKAQGRRSEYTYVQILTDPKNPAHTQQYKHQPGMKLKETATETEWSAVITRLDFSSPAKKAGVCCNSRIISINGRKVEKKNTKGTKCQDRIALVMRELGASLTIVLGVETMP